MIPGSGVIMMAPVSVCHQVSTIGQRSWPMFSWYRIHASGLIGSPTEPSSRSELRSRRAAILTPAHERADRGRRRVEDRHAVALDQLPETVRRRPVGAPSYIRIVAPVASGRKPHSVARHPANIGRAPVDIVVFRSKTRFDVAYVPTRYPPVECTMPLGFPVVPDVRGSRADVIGIHRFGLAVRRCSFVRRSHQ